MLLIAGHLIDEFCIKHPLARVPAQRWSAALLATVFIDFNHVRSVFRHADYAVPFTIFNIGGNSYRIVVEIDYVRGIVKIRWLMTHAEYSRWTQKYHQGQFTK